MEKDSGFLEGQILQAAKRFFGMSSIKLNPKIKQTMYNRLSTLWGEISGSTDPKDGPAIDAAEFSRQAAAIAAQVAADKSGSTVNISNVFRNPQGNPQQEWAILSDLLLKEMEGEYKIDKTLFTRFAGGTSLDIDSEIKSELRTKILKLMKDAGIGSGAVRGGSGAEAEDEDKGKGKISKAELFKKIVAAVAAIEAEVTSGTASVASLTGGLNASNEDIAKI
jgi:hypothetical protein